MHGNLITLVALPLGLAFIMVSLGLGLTPDDFRRVVRRPRGVAIGMVNLLFVAPLLAFGVAELCNLPPELAVGLVLLGAAPGGTMANLMTHLAKGETALSVTLTGLSSAMAVLTVPAYLVVSTRHFGVTGVDTDIDMLPVAARVLVITLLPLAIGMTLRNKRTEWAVRNEPKFKRISIGLFVVIVGSAIVSEWGRVSEYLGDVIIAVVLLNVAAMSISFMLARAARLNEASATAIALELGLHNATLAIAVGAAVSTEMTVPAAVYGLFMWLTGGLFAVTMAKRNARLQGAVQDPDAAAA